MLQRLACLLLIVCVFFSCKDKDSTPIIHNPNSQLDEIDVIIEEAESSSDVIEKIGLLDDALKLTLKLNDTGDKRAKLSQIGIGYYRLKKYEEFKNINVISLKLSKKIIDSFGIAKSYSNLGSYYDVHNIKDSAYFNYFKADQVYSELSEQYPNDHGIPLYNMAVIQKNFKDYIGSESNMVKATEKFKKSNSSSYLYFCHNYLAILAKDQGRYNDALKYYRLALQYAKQIDNSKYREIQVLNNIGVVFKEQKLYDKATESYQEALNYQKLMDDNPLFYARLLDNLSYARFLSGSSKDVLKLLKLSKKIRDSLGNKSDQITSNLHLAEYYSSIQKNTIAKEYALRGKIIADNINSKTSVLKALLILKEISSEKENLIFANQYIKLSDSLQRQERFNKDKFARVKFETEEKEQQIVEKEAQIVQKEAQIAIVENQNTIYLLGMLLLVMGITFAIYFFRQRTKYLAQQNQMVQFQASYETETRISKRLHDELGNDIFQVMLQYQNDPHDSQILEKLNTTYARARDISRENNEFDIDESFSEELSDMLKNYTKNGIQLLVRGLDKINWQGFEAPVKITVYRVLQELMTNMQKHSQASMVVLVFNQDNNTLHIKYTDNGVGIDKTQLQSKNGLHNTEKRIRAIDGTLIFESEKEKGFKANISIPN